ncbi:MAG: 30S ribosomal protein S8 [Myxococcota bacterium]
MMTDPVADMLARLRNASIAGLDRTQMPLSKLKLAIAKILKEEGYVGEYEVTDKELIVFMKYGRDRACAFTGIRRTSRPGRRVYVGRSDIPKVHNGLGVAILSTSRGVMTDRDARTNGVGGEVLCEVW